MRKGTAALTFGPTPIVKVVCGHPSVINPVVWDEMKLGLNVVWGVVEAVFEV